MDTTDAGYIYVMLRHRPEAATRILKIGKTQRHPRRRAYELTHHESDGDEHEVLLASYFEASLSEIEKAIHSRLRDYRPGRAEQFKVPVTEAVNALLDLEQIYDGRRWHHLDPVPTVKDDTHETSNRSDPDDATDYPISPSIGPSGREREEPLRHPDQEQFVKGLRAYLEARGFWSQHGSVREVRNVTFNNVARIANAPIAISAGIYYRTQEWRTYIYIQDDLEKTALDRLRPYLDEIAETTGYPLEVKTGRTGRTHDIQYRGPYTRIDEALFEVVYTNLRCFREILRCLDPE